MQEFHNLKEQAKYTNLMTKHQLKEFLLKHKNLYLDEYLLRFYIQYFFFGNDIIFNKQLKDTKYRPDILIPERKLVIEFDGPTHYTDNNVILNDELRDKTMQELGYTIIRIPNFIQFTKNEMQYLFKNYIIFPDDTVYSNFPHGFWNKKVTLPSSFCTRGIIKYNNIIIELSNNIHNFHSLLWLSYEHKIVELQSIRKVFAIEQLYEIPYIEKCIRSSKLLEPNQKDNLREDYYQYKQEIHEHKKHLQKIETFIY